MSTLVKIGKLCNVSDGLQYTPNALDAFNNTPDAFNELDVLNSSTLDRDGSTLIPVATVVHNITCLDNSVLIECAAEKHCTAPSNAKVADSTHHCWGCKKENTFCNSLRMLSL